MRLFSVLLFGAITATATETVRADIYREVAANGTVTLSNIYRDGRQQVRIQRHPARAAKPQRPYLPPPAAFAGLVAQAAAEHGLPEALLHAVIHAESNYDPRALSARGAAGLMQLMPDTARELGVEDVWDPAANILGGARYLKRLLAMFDNDLQLALAAYNAGPGAVSSHGRAIPPFAETQRYVPKVLDLYHRLLQAERRALF